MNAPNMKRLEVRSEVAKERRGLKAEILMVQNGGQVSLK